MEQNNFDFNPNQGFNPETPINEMPNEAPQMSDGDIYAQYNQEQSENAAENSYQQNNASYNDYSQPVQNVNPEGFNGYNQEQPNYQYPPYNQNNAYGNMYNQNNYGDYNQPQQYNAAYYNQQYPMYDFREAPKTFAIFSLVLGIASTFFGCCMSFLTIFSSIAGLVLGIVSLNRKESGKGMAIAGIILSAVGIVLSIAFIILIVVAMITEGEMTTDYLYY